MHRFLDAANALTLLSLTAALACVLLAVNGRTDHAVVALILSGLCDLFDGWLARRLTRSDEQRLFGSRLDSVVDACAFGLAPVVLLYASGLTSPMEVALLTLYACCAVWRLAYFDTVTRARGEVRFHEGLPTTYAALMLPLAYLAGLAWSDARRPLLVSVTLLLAVAMVTTVRVPKPRGVAYAIFLAAGLVSIGVFLIAGVRHELALAR